ncbi:polyprenyl synthetase family protein [Acaryochloris marina]|uniref:polyprenyl synthetase family protein n=1 Tax=Acaryochloris marina TaxID=155978 RepID=UPI0021C45804|nr:polyprenyl synthetase family protein [Acaryochloris marina]BDM83655.1 hypothetical protein AM10699_65160 [Acaryochloris marina MBIC10699]
MQKSLFQPGQLLSEIRGKAVEIASHRWPELGSWLSIVLPNPLGVMALIPVGTGIGTGAQLEKIIRIAAAIVLVDLSLRIVDDCTDQDNPNALYIALGPGTAMNYAMSLNTIAACEFSKLSIADHHSNNLLSRYFNAFIDVCHGQDLDIKSQVNDLDDYKRIVNLKSIPAYEFSAVSGAYLSTSEERIIVQCSRCGAHLGWMAQILDDIESLWFPVNETLCEIEKKTFPILFGMFIDHDKKSLLNEVINNKEYDRRKICKILDEMSIRNILVNLALDHRDRGIESLNHLSNDVGKEILQNCLAWYFRDGIRLLDDV